MPEVKRPTLRHPDCFRWAALLAATVVFLLVVARFHIPGKGFTALITFGVENSGRYLAEIDPQTTYLMPESGGYDSQWYAQLAVAPDVRDPRLGPSIDNLPYRARRILFSWTAHAFGLGRPDLVLQVFALQNVVAWLLLAALLLRWLPPRDWENVVRWVAILFSFGFAFSIRGALVDGPGLLLIAGGMALAETGRPWCSALVFGLSGLGKETGILAGAALARPNENTLRAWALVALRGLVIVGPLALWTAYLIHLFGVDGSEAGSRNFALPFVGFWTKTANSFLGTEPDPSAFAHSASGVLTSVSLATQFLFFALRPRWRDAWWRVGASFAVLMVFLGEAVWEGYPCAAARVLLPMLLAFNLTVPRGWRWWLVLLLGNLTILSTPNFIALPTGIEPATITGPITLRQNGTAANAFRADFEGPWLPPQRSLLATWRWTAGSVELRVHNPHPFPVEAALSFGVNSRDPRSVRLLVDGQERWCGRSTPRSQTVAIDALRLAPGATRLRFETDRPAEQSLADHDTRPLAFRVLDLQLQLRAPASP